MSFRVAVAVACALAFSAAGPALAQVHKYVVMAGGEQVGHLTASIQVRHVSVDYAVVNNGRGPKAKEEIDLDAAGMPVSWKITGESLFGAPVNEHFTWKAGKAEWVSQADRGSVPAVKPLLYIGNDVSPWMHIVYVKALLKAPGRTLPVLPSGRLRLTEVRKVTVGDGAAAVPLTVYELSGIDLNPDCWSTPRATFSRAAG